MARKKDRPLLGWKEALRKNFKRVPSFRVCGNCGEGALFEPYDPKLLHEVDGTAVWLWCYNCGAKNDEAKPRPREGQGGGSGKSLAKEIRDLRGLLIERGWTEEEIDRWLEERMR